VKNFTVVPSKIKLLTVVRTDETYFTRRRYFNSTQNCSQVYRK